LDRVIRRLLPGDGGVDLQHLRRFAKARDVPDAVREAFERARVEVLGGCGETTSTESGSTQGRQADNSNFSNSLDASGHGVCAVEVGKVMPGGMNFASSESNLVQESSSTALDDLGSRGMSDASLSAQGQEMIASDAPKSESVAPSAQSKPKGGPDAAAASIPTLADPRIKTDNIATELFLIVGSTNAISSAVVAEELSVIINDAVIFSIQVPRLAPTSQEQATLWSSQYWPTVYKKSNPFGPHPSIVSRTEQEIHGEVGKWMDLASEVARQADGTGSGETVGVVIVERKNGIGHPVAVAGDARWVDWPSKGPGNVTAHAALRAIAMVADGVKATSESGQTFNAVSASVTQPEFKADPADQCICNGSTSIMQLETEKIAAEQATKAGVESSPPDSQKVISDTKPNTDVTFMYAGQEKQVGVGNIFQDKAVLDTERDHCDLSGTVAGYLCHDLEIYCTHEPCVMCSMAILHSRFGKVIFQYRMPKTGGMCADGDLGHGLFWRKELNWTLLAWQWIRSSNGQSFELADFHA
jgi:tRNA-specific adenosine deaminase 3